ncbi:MAG: class I SAM-dependent methyltransferase [Gemmatimonadaceae bacterium]
MAVGRQSPPVATFPDHFSSVAPGYAAYRPRYPAALFDFLADLAPARALAWDCACGSGQATIDIAERFERVIATDASAAQLQQAPAHPRIEWRVAPAEQSGIASGRMDLVTIAQALHWVNVDAFFAEARRVMKPSGVLAVWSYSGLSTGDDHIDALVRHYSHDIVGPCWPPQRRMVDDGYRSIELPFPELEAPAFAMEERWTLEQLLGYIRTWSATARFMETRREDPTGGLAARLARVWGDRSRVRRVEWPLTLRLGVHEGEA